MRVLVTGGSGFVGSGVLARLVRDGSIDVRAAVRKPVAPTTSPAVYECIGEIDAETNWSGVLEGVDVVVHAAARVHVMRDVATDPLMHFRRVNVHGTLRLARQAAAAGVRRLVFISSIKVNGEQSPPGRPFEPDDTPQPVGPYATSKYEAENGLRQIAAESELDIVVIRPVMVYGPGVRANFLALMRAVYRRIPLPLGAVHNRRSLVARDNLVDLVYACLSHPRAANETFLASDGEDMSTAALVSELGRAMDRRPVLIPIPEYALRLVMRSMGDAALLDRLCGSLQVDISKNQELLGWTPPFGTSDALRATTAWFLATMLDSHRRDSLR